MKLLYFKSFVYLRGLLYSTILFLNMFGEKNVIEI